MEIKTYKRRDSAVATLRKLGIKPRDYDLFIEKEDGQVNCLIGKAREHLRKLQPKPKTVKKPKPKKEKGVTIASVCRGMILDGKDNAAIFKALQDIFGEERFNEDKRHYPAWYRCEMRRNGALPPAFDPERKDKTAIHKFED